MIVGVSIVADLFIIFPTIHSFIHHWLLLLFYRYKEALPDPIKDLKDFVTKGLTSSTDENEVVNADRLIVAYCRLFCL